MISNESFTKIARRFHLDYNMNYIGFRKKNTVIVASHDSLPVWIYVDRVNKNDDGVKRPNYRIRYYYLPNNVTMFYPQMLYDYIDKFVFHESLLYVNSIELYLYNNLSDDLLNIMHTTRPYER